MIILMCMPWRINPLWKTEMAPQELGNNARMSLAVNLVLLFQYHHPTILYNVVDPCYLELCNKSLQL